jgi:hypothetical protein
MLASRAAAGKVLKIAGTGLWQTGSVFAYFYDSALSDIIPIYRFHEHHNFQE